jgi:bifunctional NMN adenylyltransferase/nudix hydrolase
MYDFTVFIGRFQPVHNGHLSVIKQALDQSHKLIILVGSSNRARDIRNPFTSKERIAMIESCLTMNERSRIFFHPLDDFMYQDSKWVENVQSVVDRVVNLHQYEDAKYKPSIALIGHSKDATGFFLKLFPQWKSLPVINPPNINATDIRNIYFGQQPLPVENYLPKSVYDWMADWRWEKNPKEYAELLEEFEHVIKYKKQWSNVPYPVIFQTVDVLIEQSGHVLLVRRGASPGKGRLALPGGFLNPNERLLDGAIRELYEETKIDVPEKVIRGCIINSHTFDDPHRSTRGRTITHTIHVKLEDRVDLPKIARTKSDDAAASMWLPWSQWKCEDTFEDHWFQGQYFKK